MLQLEQNGQCFEETPAPVGEVPNAVIDICKGKEIKVMKEKPCQPAPADNGETDTGKLRWAVR